MKRLIPNELLLILENWLSECSACVKLLLLYEIVHEVHKRKKEERNLTMTYKHTQ